MPRQGRLRALPVAGLVLVGGLTVAAVGALLVSRDQSRVAQFVEAVVALSGAASSLAGLLLPRLRGQGQDSAAGSITGLPVAVPTGQLPVVVRGRAGLMGQLRRLLRAPMSGPAILAGMGGAGKSTVAAAFADAGARLRFGRWRRYVWWVSAADLSSLTGGLVTVARQLGASRADLEVIRAGGLDGPDRLWALLDGSDRRWLLVFDNADDPSVLANAPPAALGGGAVAGRRLGVPADGTGWLRRSSRGLVVVTTRDRDPATWGRAAQVLAVDPLAESDAAQVLQDCAPRAGDEADARLLARRLGGLPLPLRLAGSSLDSDVALRRSFGEYLRALDEPGHRPRLLTSRPGIGVAADPRSIVMRTWEMSLDDCARRGLPQARPLLRVLSCFAPATPIPRGVLAARHLDRLLAVGREGAGSLTQAQAEYRLEDGLHGLRALSLIEIRPFGGTSADGRAVVVHPVVAATNLAHLADARDGEGDTALVWCAAIEIMAAALRRLDDDRASDWPDYLALGPHLHALFATAARHVDHQHLRDLVAITTMASSAHVLCGAIPEGERLARANVDAANLLGADDPVILRARHEFAWSIAMQGHHAKAEALFREVLASSLRSLGEDHSDTLNTYNELAWIAACQQRWAEAEAGYRNVLAGRSRLLGEDHPATLITRHELGWVIANQGRGQEAEPILEGVLLARQRLLGERHPRTIMTRHELAWTAATQGRLPAAEAAYRQVVRARRDVLGDQHPSTLTAQDELAWVMALAGKRRAALTEYKTVLTARAQILGDTHPDTLATHNALASLLRKGAIVTPRHIP